MGYNIMFIKEIKLHSTLKYVKDTDDITTVKNELINNNVSTQIVVDNANNICGIITDRDIIKVDSSKYSSTKAKDICTNTLLTISEYDSIDQASKLMVNNKCHHLLIVDKTNEKICGILSSIDIVNYYSNLHVGIDQTIL